jgi:hypothetical protein
MSWEVATIAGIMLPAFVLIYLFSNLEENHLFLKIILLGASMGLTTLGLSVTYGIYAANVVDPGLVEIGVIISIIVNMIIVLYVFVQFLLFILNYLGDLVRKRRTNAHIKQRED